MTIYIGSAVATKEYEVEAEDEAEARNIIMDEADKDFFRPDFTFVKDIERVG